MLIEDREILAIILELTKAVRCCRQDGICCEDISFTQFTILDTIAGCRMDVWMDVWDALKKLSYSSKSRYGFSFAIRSPRSTA
jgi:hypothetical protein